MKIFLRGTVFATALVGVLALPTNLDSPQNEIASSPPAEGNKETKHIFGIDFDLNLLKNTTLIPNPSFINLSTGYGDGWDLGGGIVFPSYFPLSLIIPPFNLTYDINKYQQASLDINAGAGDLSAITSTPAPGWEPSTTPGWAPPTTTTGWTTTTSGWTTSKPGWTTTSTPGWTTTTTQGWAPPSTAPTPGWIPSVGWSWSKSQDEAAIAAAAELKGAPGNVPSKPIIAGDRDKPKPAQPSLQISENYQNEGKAPSNGGESQNYMSNVAQSTLSSELPAPIVVADEPEEVEEKEHYYNPIYHTMMHTTGSGSMLKPLASMAVFQDAIPGDEDRKKSVGKARRHAELMHEEDPESFADPEEKDEHSIADDVVRKSELSLEKAVSGSPSYGPNGPNKGNTNYNGRNKPRPYGMDKPSKTRPILGQDKNNRPQNNPGSLIHSQKEEIPILDESINSDSTSVFGFQIPSINWSSFTDIFENFMGSKTLTTKTGAMGKLAKSDRIYEVSGEKCIEDEEDLSNSEVRSPKDEFEGGYLCGAGKESDNGEVKLNLCSKACIKNGFAGGSCVIRQDLMPGCLCRMPNSRDWGMMLELFRDEPKNEAEAAEQLLAEGQNAMKSSRNSPCKRCGCLEACKKEGSFTGFCAEKCYCANPFYTRTVKN